MSDFPRYSVSGRLAIETHVNPQALGLAAARSVSVYLRDLLARQKEARVIFACAPSQNEFLTALIDPSQTGVFIDWTRVTAFHMDDYVGLSGSHPNSFRAYLEQHFLRQVPISAFHPIPGETEDSERVCAAYARLLAEGPIDLICLGIGENGHIAFNDPHVADFDDKEMVRKVELDDACRRQQVSDGCFATLEDVPRFAYSLTVPVFRRANRLSIHVHGKRKAAAVRATIAGPISTECPASILRLHRDACLYIDADASTN